MIRSFMRLTTAVAITAVFGFGVNAQAQAPAASGGYKIGVVNMQQVLAEYDKRESKYKELEAEVQRLQAPIDALTSKIETNKKAFDTAATEDDKFRLKQQIDQDYAAYRAELERNQAKIDSLEEAVLKEVLTDVQNALKEVAKAGNYHLVLNGNSGPRSSVLYHDPTIDITPQLMQVLNKK